MIRCSLVQSLDVVALLVFFLQAKCICANTEKYLLFILEINEGIKKKHYWQFSMAL